MRTETSRHSIALDGIRVLDLTTTWSGPLCTRMLADLGAQVIKIEAPSRPDGTRSAPGYFSWLNWNKYGVTLNLNVPAARECFKRLVEKSELVVENFSPRVMRNFGLDYSVLRRIKPDIIVLSMPAYGSGGPYQDYVAYGPGLEASSGLAALTGYENESPMLSGSAYGDPVAGMHGFVAVLAALRHRRRTGEGQWVELAQREALSQMFGEAFLLAAKGISLSPCGNRHPSMAPHRCYRTRERDQWIAIAVQSDAHWRAFCRAIGKDSLVDDPRFASLSARLANRDALDQEVQAWTFEQDSDEAVRQLQSNGVAAGKVMDGQSLSDNRHLNERGFFRQVTNVDGEVCSFPYLPWKSNGSIRNKAPQVGEHNREILGGLLGLTDAQIQALQ